MYVCVCKAITCSDIDDHVQRGIRSFGDLVKKTGISTQCNICIQEAKRVLKDRMEEDKPTGE